MRVEALEVGKNALDYILKVKLMTLANRFWNKKQEERVRGDTKAFGLNNWKDGIVGD